MQKTITIFLPIHQNWQIENMIKLIAKLDKQDYKVNLLIILDNIQLQTNRIKDLFIKETGLEVMILNTKRHPESEMYMQKRRIRIADIVKTAQKLIPGESDFVFMIESDTVIDSDVLIRLMNRYKEIKARDNQIGLVSGVQVGRWGIRMLGIWKTDNIENSTEFNSLKLNLVDEITEVDATGFYCFVISRDNFVNNSFEDLIGPLGPDVSFGLSLRKQGLKNYVDWSIACGHNCQNRILYPTLKCDSISYIYFNDEWKRI